MKFSLQGWEQCILNDFSVIFTRIVDLCWNFTSTDHWCCLVNRHANEIVLWSMSRVCDKETGLTIFFLSLSLSHSSTGLLTCMCGWSSEFISLFIDYSIDQRTNKPTTMCNKKKRDYIKKNFFLLFFFVCEPAVKCNHIDWTNETFSFSFSFFSLFFSQISWEKSFNGDGTTFPIESFSCVNIKTNGSVSFVFD